MKTKIDTHTECPLNMKTEIQMHLQAEECQRWPVNQQKLGQKETISIFVLWDLRRNQPHHNFDLYFLASRTVQKYVVFSPVREWVLLKVFAILRLSSFQWRRWETQFRSLGHEDPLEEGMATHSSILAWRIPMNRGAWPATVQRVANRGTQLKQLIMHTCILKYPFWETPRLWLPPRRNEGTQILPGPLV